MVPFVFQMPSPGSGPHVNSGPLDSLGLPFGWGRSDQLGCAHMAINGHAGLRSEKGGDTSWDGIPDSHLRPISHGVCIYGPTDWLAEAQNLLSWLMEEPLIIGSQVEARARAG